MSVCALALALTLMYPLMRHPWARKQSTDHHGPLIPPRNVPLLTSQRFYKGCHYVPYKCTQAQKDRPPLCPASETHVPSHGSKWSKIRKIYLSFPKAYTIDTTLVLSYRHPPSGFTIAVHSRFPNGNSGTRNKSF